MKLPRLLLSRFTCSAPGAKLVCDAAPSLLGSISPDHLEDPLIYMQGNQRCRWLAIRVLFMDFPFMLKVFLDLSYGFLVKKVV